MPSAIFSAHGLWLRSHPALPTPPQPIRGLDTTWNVTNSSLFPKVCALDQLLQNHRGRSRGGRGREDLFFIFIFYLQFPGSSPPNPTKPDRGGGTSESCISSFWPTRFWYMGQFENLNKNGLQASQILPSSRLRRSETCPFPQHTVSCPEPGPDPYRNHWSPPALHFLLKSGKRCKSQREQVQGSHMHRSTAGLVGVRGR